MDRNSGGPLRFVIQFSSGVLMSEEESLIAPKRGDHLRISPKFANEVLGTAGCVQTVDVEKMAICGNCGQFVKEGSRILLSKVTDSFGNRFVTHTEGPHSRTPFHFIAVLGVLAGKEVGRVTNVSRSLSKSSTDCCGKPRVCEVAN